LFQCAHDDTIEGERARVNSEEGMRGRTNHLLAQSETLLRTKNVKRCDSDDSFLPIRQCTISTVVFPVETGVA
jgi:hypothetical protein